MTDNALLFVDLSSNNPLPDLKKHYAAGFRVIALKATEGTGYGWDHHGSLSDQWHKLGGSVWHYHFSRPGSGVAQADYFLRAVNGHYRRGDRIVCDAEVAGIGPAFVRDFIGRCHERVPTWPGVVYSYSSFLSGAKIKPTHGWGLWLAAYGPTQPKPVAGWSSLVAWQFTDKAAGLPGMGAPVDCSHLLDVPAPKPDPDPAPALDPKQRRRIRRAIRVLRSVLNPKG